MESFEIANSEADQLNVYAATNLKGGLLGCLEELQVRSTSFSKTLCTICNVANPYTSLQGSARTYMSENFTDPNTPKHHKLNNLLLLPFAALRFASVPLTAPEEYARGSLFLSSLCWPFWVEVRAKRLLLPGSLPF